MKQLITITTAKKLPAKAQLGGGGPISFILTFIELATAIIGFFALIREFLGIGGDPQEEVS